MRKNWFGIITPRTKPNSSFDKTGFILMLILGSIIAFMIYNQITGDFVFGYDSSDSSDSLDSLDSSDSSDSLDSSNSTE